MNTEDVIKAKQELVQDEDEFLRIARVNFTTYHQQLVLALNKLRKVVFPEGAVRNTLDKRLY